MEDSRRRFAAAWLVRRAGSGERGPLFSRLMVYDPKKFSMRPPGHPALWYRGANGEAVQHADFAGAEVFVDGSGSDLHWP